MISQAPERHPLFERRPALIILLALIAGITAGNTASDPAAYLIYYIAGLGLCLSAALLFRRQPAILAVSTCIAAFAFGSILIIATNAKDRKSLLANAADTECTLIGEITDVRDGDYLYLRIACDSLVDADGSHAATNEAAGVFFYRTDSTKHPTFSRGMRVKVCGEVVAFTGQRNPYAFDHDQYLKTSESIDAVMYCDSYYDISITGTSERTLYDAALGFFDGLRSSTKTTITNIVSDSLVRGFVLAMVLGEKRALPDEVWDDFRQAGLSHILVVSGFNLGIVAWVFYILLRLLRITQRELRIILVMAGTLFYGALIGPQPSVIRAVIVVEFILLAKLLERRADLTNLTAGAALLNLALAPAEVFNVSFQLSYSAVFALTLLAPSFDRLLLGADETKKKHWYHRLLKIAVGTAAVLFGTLPVVLFHFHQLSVIAILTNLLTIPLASAATVLSILIIPLSLVSAPLASIYVDAVGMIVSLMRAVADVAASISFAVIRLPHPSSVFIGAYVLALLYVTRALTWQVAAARLSGACIIFVSLFSFGPAVAASLFDNGTLSVVFVDVGQGDATLIATPNGKHYLVDAGGVTRSGKSISERTIMPLLAAEGIDHLDGVFVTHMHLDHYGGMAELVAQGLIDTIYTCGDRASSQNARTLDSCIARTGVPVRTIGAGGVIALDDEVRAYVLAPAENVHASANERALVLKIVYNDASLLLPADISAETEEQLVVQYGAFLKCDLVKVAHHGSRLSSAPSFIKTVAAADAVFSAGRRNRHGHPNAEVVARWEASGTQTHRTDREGAILFRSTGTKFTESTWR